jgi:hypothetical protein
MQRKVILMISSSLLVFSLQGFSQTTTPAKSLHPKMDKYYPQAQKTEMIRNPDTIVVTAPSKPITTTTNAPVMTTAPVATDNMVQPKPSVTPTIPQAPEPEMPTTSAVTSIPVSVDTANSPTTSSTTISKPSTVTVNAPVQKPAPQPAPGVTPSSLFTTRLGSSSPQYDTWKKNSNGAGSVTTNPKQ